MSPGWAGPTQASNNAVKAEPAALEVLFVDLMNPPGAGDDCASVGAYNGVQGDAVPYNGWVQTCTVTDISGGPFDQTK